MREIRAQPEEVVLPFHCEGPRTKLRSSGWAPVDLLSHLARLSFLFITRKITAVKLAVI